MERYCFALDLVDDPELIAEYEKYHEKIWPEIEENIKASGILDMEIYRIENRLFMIMETEDGFSFEKKDEIAAQSSKDQEWEELMWKYQKALPTAKSGEKWLLMKRIFKL
ncbi:L-rhamnose mutarotase [Marinilongibacter aquaticus]|uniref:L-rhamnose mutarotase n=1 Tax=Marinilongibacter aquaticus TaxID=2975157 RepID=UPI0021BD9187|nr:L-rhamnose mutarotase [Marinilongibacter aquaticus]UBM57785.1 L-rhamnose mutarotase [Marinilongibacter aquaticus]